MATDMLNEARPIHQDECPECRVDVTLGAHVPGCELADVVDDTDTHEED